MTPEAQHILAGAEARQRVVVRAELVGRAVDGSSGGKFVVDADVERVSGVAVRARLSIQHVGGDPVGEDIAKAHSLADSGEKLVDAGRSIAHRPGDQAVRGIAAEAAGEIPEERSARAVVRQAALAVPVVELRRRLRGERLDRGSGAADKHRAVFGETLVDPGFLEVVGVGVDHVLKLVGEYDVEGGAAGLQRAIHVHHLGLVAEGPDGAQVLVVAGIVAADRAAEISLQDDDARVAVDARDVGLAEDARDDGPGRRVERIGGRLHIGCVRAERIVLVEVGVRALGEQRRANRFDAGRRLMRERATRQLRDDERPRVANIGLAGEGLRRGRAAGGPPVGRGEADGVGLRQMSAHTDLRRECRFGIGRRRARGDGRGRDAAGRRRDDGRRFCRAGR